MRYRKYGFGKSHKVKAKLSIHSINRIKKRLGIKNKYKCKEFINSATTKGILLADIPRIPRYKQFSSYMYSIVKNTKNKCQFNSVYLYKNAFIIVAMDGTVITCINVHDRFKDIFFDIVEFLKNKETSL